MMESMRRKVVVREEDTIGEPELLSRADCFDPEAEVMRPDTVESRRPRVRRRSSGNARVLLSKVAVER